MKNVIRKPNSSRIRSLSPLPVTAPMREQISWITIKATRDRNHGPQQHVSELRPGLRVG